MLNVSEMTYSGSGSGQMVTRERGGGGGRERGREREEKKEGLVRPQKISISSFCFSVCNSTEVVAGKLNSIRLIYRVQIFLPSCQTARTSWVRHKNRQGHQLTCRKNRGCMLCKKRRLCMKKHLIYSTSPPRGEPSRFCTFHKGVIPDCYRVFCLSSSAEYEA